MLIVLLGTSGAGKTSVMKFLHEDYGVIPITVQTSRPARKDDYNKISGIIGNPTPETHEIQEAFGNVYVQLKDDLVKASISEKKHVIDISPVYLNDFLKYTKYFFSITLPIPEDYELRLVNSGRVDRLDEVRKDVRLATEIKDPRVVCIINRDSRESARNIMEYLE